MRLIAILVLALLAGVVEARMPEVGDHVNVWTPILVFEGWITAQNENWVAFNCTTIGGWNPAISDVNNAAVSSYDPPIEICIGKSQIIGIMW
jgi:hypothetical protein